MIARYVMATIGGCLITLALLLGTNQIAQTCNERDPTRYCGTTEFVALPDGRRPTAPPAPAMPPPRPRLDVRSSGTPDLPVQIPRVDQDRVAPPPLIPEPDPNAVARPARRPE